jgi:alkanesulfonate monooxygenase SsuD/methylene tetrahydromethanopterin reductase-like flavin-dependent oxidoreductase (luciferase family)
MTMRYGVILPGGTAPQQLDLAVLAERAGWDGVFVWEAAYGVDAWTLLGAMASATSRVTLGTLLTPLPWRRPWKVASQAVTLDQLSGGRAVLAVGLGATETDLPDTGEATDRRIRAEMLDEGIDLIRMLWAGQTHFAGRHYRYDCARDDLSRVGTPVQDPIPIWAVGAWPKPRSMRRIVRCDGVIPEYHLDGREATPDDVRELCTWLASRGARADIDVTAEGETPAGDVTAARDLVAPWADAGCTWWMETRWEVPHDAPERLADIRARLAAGPPSVT